MSRFYLVIAFVTASSALAQGPSFDQGRWRYLKGYDVFRVLQQKFPLIQGTQGKSSGPGKACDAIDLNALGFSRPADGELPLKAPSLGFVKWYTRCVRTLIDQDISLNSNADRYLGSDVIKKIEGTEVAKIRDFTSGYLWSKVPASIQNGIIHFLTREFIGVDIVNDEDRFAYEIFQTLKTTDQLTAEDAIKKIVFAITMRDEFLTY